MSKFSTYQLIVTDINGLLSGATFDDPVSALRMFAIYSQYLTTKEAIFHVVGTTQCTLSTEGLTFAVLFNDGEDLSIGFSTRTEKEVISHLSSLQQDKNKDSSVTVIDLITGEVVYEYKFLKETFQEDLTNSTVC